jgi:hypothetical protein
MLKHIPEDYKAHAEIMIDDFIKETIDDLKEYIETFTSDLIETYTEQEENRKGLLLGLEDILMR